MGTRKRASIWPRFTHSLDAGIAEGGDKIQARCSKCQAITIVDLVALRAIKGGAYSLKNKRTRCKLTPGCGGWVKFHYFNAFWWPLWDYDAEDMWMKRDEPAPANLEEALACLDRAVTDATDYVCATGSTIKALCYLRDCGVPRAPLQAFYDALDRTDAATRVPAARAGRDRIKSLVEGGRA